MRSYAFCPPLFSSLPSSTRHNALPSQRPSQRPSPHTRRRRSILHAQYSAPPNRAPDYYANVGAVIDTLRADYPHILTRPPDLSHFSENVVFSDGSRYRVRGRDAYLIVLWLLRAQVRLFLSGADMKIQSLYHDDAEGALYVRWRMCATPRWLASRSRLVVDGLSLYRLDTRGLVCEHSLENNARRRDHVRPLFEGVLSKVGAKGSVVGAGAGVPGWYRTVLEPVDLVTFPNRTHVEETTTDVNEQAAMEQDINVMSFL